MIIENYKDLGIEISTNTNKEINVVCPFCKEQHPSNRNRKCLSVNLAEGVFYCHRCGAKGRVGSHKEQPVQTEKHGKPEATTYKTPAWHPEFINAPCDALTYLTEQRKLTLETLKALKVSQPWVRMPKENQASPEEPTATQAGSPEGAPESKQALSPEDTTPATGETSPANSGEAAAMQAASPEGATPATGSSQKVGLEQVIAFNYFLDGKLTNIKYRSTDKRFLSFKGGHVIPYNIDSIKDKPMCCITEGEIDALTLHQCGYTSVVSVPSGGNTNLRWLEEFWATHFADKQYFVLALDNDKVGLQLRDTLTARLGDDKCRIVNWHKGCKDANEQLVKHGRRSVVRCITAAAYPPLDNVYTAEDLTSELKDVFHNRIQRGLKVGLDTFDELVSFEPKRLLTVTGKPGEGKSEFVDELVVRLNVFHGWKTAFFSPENVPIALHLRKLSEKITGYRFEPSVEMTDGMFNAVQGWLGRNIYHILPREESFELDTILETARVLVERKQVKVLVIDPFNRIEQRLNEGQTELQYISSILNRLVRFAQQMSVLVILVAHPRKVNRSSYDGRSRRVEMNDINGSADFGNKSDICLTVDRNDERGVTTIFVDKVRFKHLGKRGSCYLHYEVMNGRFNPCDVGRVYCDDGDVADRYTNVRWQVNSWIHADGSISMPLGKPAAAFTPPIPTMATLPFSNAEQ